MQRLVSIRTIHGRDGAIESTSTVPCPVDARMRTLDECLACASRIAYKADRADPWVICGRPGTDAPATIANAMTRTVACVRADVSVGAFELLLLAHGVGGAPIVDAHERLVGVASLRDVALHRRAGGSEQAHVAEIAGAEAGLRFDAPIARAADIIVFEGLHRLPVVDGDGAVVGIVTPLDLVRWSAREPA